MKKCALALFASLFLGLGIVYAYINVVWTQKAFLKNISDHASQQLGLSVSIEKIEFSPVKGLRFKNIVLSDKGRLGNLQLTISDIHTGQKALWTLWKNTTTVRLFANAPKLTLSDNLPSSLTHDRITDQKSVTNRNLTKLFQPINKHFETFLNSLFARMIHYWSQVDLQVNQGSAVADIFIPQWPQPFQKSWTDIQGTLSFNLTHPGQFETLIRGQHQGKPFALNASNTAASTANILAHYEGQQWNLKLDCSMEHHILNLKSLIGSLNQLKFYSRGSINTQTLAADLSNIININLEHAPLPLPEYFKEIDLKGNLDLFLGVQGPLLNPQELLYSGSLSAGYLSVNGIEFSHSNADFQWKKGLLSIHPIKFHLNDQKIQASASVDFIEPLEPLMIDISSSSVSLSTLQQLLSLYTKELPQEPIKANAQLEAHIKLPLKNFREYEINGHLKADNILFKDNATLWRNFEEESEIKLQSLQPNQMDIDFHWTEQRLKVNEFKVSHPNIVILSRGTMDSHQNILFRLATAQKVVRPKKSLNGKDEDFIETKQEVLELKGTVNRPSIAPVTTPL